jgi:CheY-like chemotaxis protein
LARRILLADDSVTAQNMGRRILTDAGYEVVTVNNGSAALKKIAENRPDLIVLDVYMPGYGGLEVCQRVKENPETRSIPVLLTVGKLEPFKGEEARRVGADAFIIKPFEATELLTVLTKLEDKIVAQPQPQKSGRFARALAAVQQSDTGDRFGDKETGWKNRLTIPSPNAQPKTEDEVPENIATTSHVPQQVEVDKPVEAPREFERPIPAGLPVDITPEEIAAITAAAATFGGGTQEPTGIQETPVQEVVAAQEVATPEAVTAQPAEAESLAVPEASVPEIVQEAQPEIPAESATQAVASIDATTDQAATDPRDQSQEIQSPAVSELPAAVMNSEPAVTPDSSSVETLAPPQQPAGDAEVMAAIASLAPSNAHGMESVQPIASGSNGNGYEGPLGVADAVSGPHWIAQSIDVAPEELKLALDLEMEQAFAARASAEAANLSAATDAVSTVSVAVAEPVESNIAAAATITESGSATESQPMAIAAEPGVVESKVIEAELIESGINEPTVADSNAVDVPQVQNQASEAIAEQSAYAAAASAGSAADHSAIIEAVAATTAAPQSNASASVETAPHREAELAAAWQNWKQIRESFVGSQPSTPDAEASAEPASNREEAVEAVQSAPAEEVADVQEVEDVEEETTTDAPEESTAIASIVDTMLAELRPKLVAEIAKKMSSEKKEKDKKKKK